jgi:hypothetical protein
MLLTTVLSSGLSPRLTRALAQGAEEAHEPAVEPWAFGLLAFVLLTLMLVALLMFGKGRPHS